MFMEKKKLSTARFMGPPPIPRKEESSPRKKPIPRLAGMFFILSVFILPLPCKTMYNIVPKVIKARTRDWENPKSSSLPAPLFINPKISFPKMPPKTEPMPRAGVIRRFIPDKPVFRVFPTDTKAMAKTVQPDKKLTADTLIILMESKKGFIITPPPMPQMEPMVEVKIDIKKRIIAMFTIPFNFSIYYASLSWGLYGRISTCFFFFFCIFPNRAAGFPTDKGAWNNNLSWYFVAALDTV